MIVVGTTLCAFAMSKSYGWTPWIANAEAMRASQPDEDIRFFAAIQVDRRGIDPFLALLDRMKDVGGEHWTYSLDDGRTKVTTGNRLRHITTGQNLVTDYACSTGASHLLFMAADCCPPPDAIPKLIEVNHPIVGGEVSSYCLFGPDVSGYPFPVQEHMATAAFVLLRREVFRFVRWRWDLESGMSDDPCLQHDCEKFLGFKTLVRKDVIGEHYPKAIGAIETRGYDMGVVR
jgi:hypothetical protein